MRSPAKKDPIRLTTRQFIAPTIVDELHAMLVKRADDLEGCPVGSDERARAGSH